MPDLLLWQSRPLSHETAQDAARRFALDLWDAGRPVVWDEGGTFAFADGLHRYRVQLDAGAWNVWRVGG